MKFRALLLGVLTFLLVFSGVYSCGSDDIPVIAIQLNPLCVQDFVPGQTQQFNACIFIDGVRQPGFENSSVTWSVLGGDVNGTITQDGFFTAPDTIPPPAAQFIIIATSNEDPQKQSQATVINAGQGSCEAFVTDECQ